MPLPVYGKIDHANKHLLSLQSGSIRSFKICFDKPEYFCELNNVGADSHAPSAT